MSECGPCVEHVGTRNASGYGYVRVGGKMRRAHRVAWEQRYGAIPDGIHVCHQCDNPGCVNPGHLFLGTASDNARDRHSKGRSRNTDPGSAHPKAKLTNAEVRDMRRLATSGMTQVQLAARFGISRGNVSKIINGRSYVNA